MWVRALCFGLLCALPAAASTSTLSYQGQLDPNNPNDVALITFDLASASSVGIQTYGYGGTSDAPHGTNGDGVVVAAGGFDPYVSLFRGSGPNATFLASNDDGGCGPAAPDPACLDSRLVALGLPKGVYTLALTLPNNFSFAENYGSGTLGDGFIGLQADYFDPDSNTVRTSAYAVDITSEGFSSVAVTPEPPSIALLLTGLVMPAILLGVRRGQRNQCRLGAL